MKSNRRYRRLTEIIRACVIRIDLKFAKFRFTCIQYVRSVYHPKCIQRLILGIIRTVTEAYESHRMLADLRAPKRQGKIHGFLIYLHTSYSSIRNFQQQRFAKARLILIFYAHISCKNDCNNFLLLNTNPPLT